MWRYCKSRKENSPTEEKQDSKQHEKQQHVAETKEEQLTLLRRSWRDRFKRKAAKQNSSKVEEQEIKQLEKQQQEAETQEEQLASLGRRTVSFAPVIETFHTLLALDHYTPESSASWFDEDDYDYDDFTYICEKIRTVSFAPVIEIFHTLALDDYTPEEISAYWFDEGDYDDFTYNCENVRTVSFAPAIETFHTLALEDYTQEEISASWFNDDDYDDIVDNCVKIIANNKSHGSTKKNEDCIRGLERMNDIGLALLNCNRSDSYDAVLEEQGVQWDNQEDDHGDRIARLYREVASRRCHVEAHQRGMQDALVAEELLLINEGHRNKAEKEVQAAVCSMRMHQKRKSIQSPPAALNKVVPSTPWNARCA
jgi:hypothetical protein